MIITLPISINAVVIGGFISSFICFFINAYFPGRLFRYGPFKQINDARKIIISTGIMALLLLFWVNIDILNSEVLILIGGIIFGTFIYVLCLTIYQEEDAEILITLAVKRIRKLKL
jgi:hypothetical protein